MQNRKFSRRLSAMLAGVGIVGLAVSGMARADAIAFASNQLTNFKITSSVGALMTVLGSPQRNTQNSASYGPTGFPAVGTSSQDPQPLGSASNAAQTVAGLGPFPGENIYTHLAGTALGMIGARGDSNTSAGSPFSVGGVPFVNNVAEARVTTGLGTSGSSAGTNQANATIMFTISLGAAGTISFDFSDLFEYYAKTSVAGEGAQGTISNHFTITNSAGNTVFNYSPAAININCASNSGVPAVCNSGLLSNSFLGTSGSLAAGNYAISLLTSSAATVTSAGRIPEPGTLLIFTLGLGSLALVSRRRSRH